MDSPLVAAVLGGLAERADPGRAQWQRDYMKSELPFHGVGLPAVRTITRDALRAHRLRSREEWEATVRELWDEAAFREERYAALAVARSGRGWLDAASLPLSRHLVVTGAWWDLVDETVQHLVGTALAADPAVVTPVVRTWSTDEEVWLRRTSVICQLRRRAETDLDLLHDAIEANVDDPSFWLRKAIGWALRQHARTDATWVLAEIDELGDRLSPLSRREALKHLGGPHPSV
jgi:3-methyladenine DNA glycosylase AlkD